MDLPQSRRGRPRQYTNNAERQRAYRERQDKRSRSRSQLQDRLTHRETWQADDGTLHEQHAERQRRRTAISRARYKSALVTADYSHPAELDIGDMDVTCDGCGALYFNCEMNQTPKGFDKCCNFGSVSFPVPQTTPKLKELMLADTLEGRNFRSNLRNYNNSFAMAALSAKLDTFTGSGPFCFRLQGQVYHKLPAVKAEAEPKYAQLYFVECDEANQLRLRHPSNVDCLESVLKMIDEELRSYNPYVMSFTAMRNVIRDEEQRAMIEKRPPPAVTMVFDQTGVDRRRYNAPTVTEVAAVYVQNAADEYLPRQYVAVQYPGGNPVYLNETDPKCDPLCYPLLRPYGDPGWHSNMEKHQLPGRKSTKITQLEYYRYLLAVRNDFNVLHHSGKLFQQYVVDIFVRVEQFRLRFQRQNQDKLRAEKYKVLVDYLTGDDDTRVGRRVILPASFTGSPRYMVGLYQDSMAIVGHFGKPDLFITFTCNGNWPEIKKNLPANQNSSNCPHLVSRVFRMKLRAMLDDIIKNEVFGKIKAYLWVIEYQKRGLPHCHMLFCLEDNDKIHSPEQLDTVIKAEIPDPEDRHLFQAVTSYNLHNRCGSGNPKLPCMDKDTGKCSKRFPKAFREVTSMDVDGFPEYKRRANGHVYKTESGEVVTSEWVVPYNPFLSVKYNAHINVELCSTISAIKYVNKYVYKGPDRAKLAIRSESGEVNYDEIQMYVDTRYVCPPEAYSRLMEFDQHGRSHVIVRLHVHLPEQQTVVFNEGDERTAVQAAQNKKTDLMAWFDLNADDQNADARQYTYRQIPEHYRFDKNRWIKRTKKLAVIGRLYTVSPKEQERFYLRIMLLNVPGARSYEDLRTVNGVLHSTFKEAALASGFIQDDNEYDQCLEEAVRSAMPSQLRVLFAYIICYCEVSNALELWNKYKGHLIEDFLRNGHSENLAIALAYQEIGMIVSDCGFNIENLIPPPTAQPLEAMDEVIDIAECQKRASSKITTLNQQQKTVFEAVMKKDFQYVFIDGPGGSGKTYLYNTLIDALLGSGKKVLCVAWSGIAATLLPHGRTVHTAFKLPVPVNEVNRSSTMSIQSKEAKMLKDIDVIIWDEAPMSHKIALEAVDLLLRDIMQSSQPFGGKQMVLGGDFRQIPPVVPKGSRSDTINASIKQSVLWSHFHVFGLSQNMRAEGQTDWADLLLKIGNGSTTSNDHLVIPHTMICNGGIDKMIEEIFGDFANVNSQDLIDRVILSTKNNDTLEINNKVLQVFPGEKKVYHSIDEVVCDDSVDKNNFPVEFINTLTPSGYPPHKLPLKKGTIVMLLRNIRINQGLCNGTRLIVKNLHKYSIGCTIATGSRKGDYVIIPRVTFLPNDNDPSPVKLKRRQFPIRVAFAMTINKSQGQTFARVGIDLRSPAFSHGQLYVAMSRARSQDQVRIITGNSTNDTVNIVYRELL